MWIFRAGGMLVKDPSFVKTECKVDARQVELGMQKVREF